MLRDVKGSWHCGFSAGGGKVSITGGDTNEGFDRFYFEDLWGEEGGREWVSPCR